MMPSKHTGTIRLIILILVAGLLFAAVEVAGADGPTFDVTIKISRLAETLDRIDALMEDMASPQLRSGTVMLRGMLRGTDWIDPTRAIVLGIDVGQTPVRIALLVPMRQPREEFRQAFNATQVEGGYLIGLQPQGQPVEGGMEERLIQAAIKTNANPVFLELDLASLTGEGKAALTQLMGAQPDSEPAAVSGEDLSRMIEAMSANLSQVESFGLGLDFDERLFHINTTAKGVDGSPLAGLLKPPGLISRLDAYDPQGHFTFRSRACDVKGIMDFMNGLYGGLYAEMGVDFNALAEVWSHFTGEAVSGMAVTERGVTFEMLAVLKDSEHLPDFAEAIYLPWLEKYNRAMAKMMEAQAGLKIDKPTQRMPDTTIEGYKVVGVRSRLPFMPMGPGVPEASGPVGQMEQTIRMTTVDNIFIVAPDDQRLAQLISTSQDTNEKSGAGPLLTARLAMGKYLKSMSGLLPPMPVEAETLSEIGDITFEVNTGGGEFQATTAIPVKDIKRFLALMGPEAQKGTTAAGTLKVPAPPEGTGEADDRAATDEAPMVKDARYWFDQGGLVAAYGNDKAAIRYFQKSLELDPTNSTALFNMGISYGELGEFERAITAINQAIALDPTQDVYYYGRGRVHLLAGDEEAARSDIARAAQGGHPDAVAYMRKHPTP